MFKTALCLALAIPLAAHAITDDEFFNTRRALRQVSARNVKASVNHFDAKKPLPVQLKNGDEARFSNLRGSFGKALLHQNTGYINTDAFTSLIFALSNTKPVDFDNIVLGTGTTLLANPQGSLAFSLAANDGWINDIRPAPTFRSEETAGEMVELYWTVLVRDVPFNDYGTDATVANAVTELNTLSDFHGPKIGGVVTTGTFLRGNTQGDLTGPYISQFLYQDIPQGVYTTMQQFTVPTQGTTNDFLTTFADWFTVVNGGLTGNTITFDGTSFIRTARDLAEYVHVDFPGQPFLNALLILNSYGSDALDPNNPYLDNQTQGGFVTYGLPQAMELIYEAVEEGLKAAWYQKWQVNRRCRPEEYGFYVQQQKNDMVDLGISSELIDSTALTNIFGIYGSYFLPQAYPEGSPTHPSYPAGHAVISGACATILKAFYNEEFQIPNPVQPDATNTALEAYGSSLTVVDELNKLASNITLGRDHAGVHYRSDGYEGLLLGEMVAIDILNNCAFLNNETFKGFNLTKFDGSKVVVGGKRKS